jgi:hypothetical protein
VSPEGENGPGGPQDAVVSPGPIQVPVAVPAPNISIKHHAWISWLQVAIEHEPFAWKARLEWKSGQQDVPMDREFKPALIATTAVSFALDALYEAMKPLISPPIQAASRWAFIAETLKRATVDGRTSSKWPSQIKSLFADRDHAVHFGETFQAPVPHPRGTNVSPELITWSPESASQAVDLGLQVVDTLVRQPRPAIKQWAEDFRQAVEDLLEQRRRLKS